MTQALLQKTANSLIKEYPELSSIQVVVQNNKAFKGSSRIAYYKPSSNEIIVRPDYPKRQTSYPLIVKALRREVIKAYNEQLPDDDESEDKPTISERLLEADPESVASLVLVTYGAIWGGLAILNKIVSGQVSGPPFPHVNKYMFIGILPLISLLMSFEFGFIQGIIVWWKRRTGKMPPRDTSYDAEETWFERASIFAIGAFLVLAILTGLVLPILGWLGL